MIKQADANYWFAFGAERVIGFARFQYQGNVQFGVELLCETRVGIDGGVGW